MSVRSFPFANQQDAPEDDYYRLHRESGVVSGLNLTMNGLGWSLSPGESYVAGSMILVENVPATGLSAATTGSSPRRDLLVARRTLTSNGSSTTVLALKVGAPATTPVDPGLTRVQLGVWEDPLFSWQVPAGGGTTATAVRDRRRWVLPETTPTALAPANGWSSPPGRGQEVSLDASGWVRLSGWIQNNLSFNGSSVALMVTLPERFRPLRAKHFPVGLRPTGAYAPNYVSPGSVSVETDGRVIAFLTNGAVPPGTYWDLSTIGFNPASLV